MQNILLAIMPYWDAMIPPNGIAHLKSYLSRFGYNVVNKDFIIIKELQELYFEYFDLIKKEIPEQNNGSFYNIGHDVLTDHMMGYIEIDSEEKYIDYVKIVLSNVYYFTPQTKIITELNDIIHTIFQKLEQNIRSAIIEFKPNVVGLTVYAGTLPASLFAFKLIKEIDPNILTVMGGSLFSSTHTVGSPNYINLINKTESYIDKIVIGQGEILFQKLLNDELPPDQRIFTKADIDNRILQFEELDLPDYSDFDNQLYPFMPLTVSTSCKYKCKFCNAVAYWGKYRIKSIKQAVDEVEVINNKYKIQAFQLTDSYSNAYINEFAEELIKRELSVYYDCYLKVDDLISNIENTMKWRKSGLYRVRLGVESGSQRVLDLMNKRITVAQTKATISALAYAGVKTTLYWVLGYPGETEEDFQKTLKLLGELKNDIWQAEAAPLSYFFSGQANSQEWEAKRVHLYPENLISDPIFQTWKLDTIPSREETYKRIFRFEAECKKLGIPNPYTLNEYYEADLRWKNLHDYAVPPLYEISDSRTQIKENLKIPLINYAKEDTGILNNEIFNF